MTDSVAIPSSAAADLRRGPLSLGLKALYGSGSIADAMVQAALASFLFFYLTAVCGLSNTLTGVSLFVALAVDAVADPLVGQISDNSWTRWGRRHPFMFAGALPLAIALGLMFSIPRGLSGGWLFVYATTVSIALRVSQSVAILPYIALGAELSDDYAERTNIVAARLLFTVVGTIVCLSLGLQAFLSGPQGLFHRAAYAPFGWSIGGVAFASMLVAAFGTLPALPRLHRIQSAKGSFARRFVRDMGELFGNRSFVILFLTVLVLFTGAGTASTLALHAAKFFWTLPAPMIQAVSLAAPVGLLLGVPISIFVSNRFEKRIVVFVSLAILTIYYAIMPVLEIFDVLPHGQALWTMLIGFQLIVGAVTACAAISFQSMMADAADEHEVLFGTRREGLYFAGLNFAAKAASGLGALVAGIGLDVIGFPTNLAAHAQPELVIAAPTLTRLGWVIGPGVAAIYLISTLIFLGYRLDRPAYAKIQQILEARRHPDAE